MRDVRRRFSVPCGVGNANSSNGIRRSTTSCPSISAYYRWTWLSPADADLIRGGSDERRRFLDLIISQQDKPYLHALIQYNKALLQRNTLLKDQSMDASLYEVLEMQLGMYGQIVYEKRKKLVEDFTPIFNEYYQTICGSAEEVGLHYISQLEETELAGKLAMSRERDRILGYTSSGIHKDELEMTLGGYLILPGWFARTE